MAKAQADDSVPIHTVKNNLQSNTTVGTLDGEYLGP